MNLKFTSLEQPDLAKIKQWRNQQTFILRQWKPLSDYQQEEWWFRINEGDKEVVFGIRNELDNGDVVLIGYCALVYIDWINRRAEYSIVIDKEYDIAYDEIFNKTTEFITNYGFNTMDLRKITTEAFSHRKHVIELLEKFGFEKEGILLDHIYKDGKYWDSHLHAIFRGA
jgi:RimJ/RimL family protein N-acetyltransferase